MTPYLYDHNQMGKLNGSFFDPENRAIIGERYARQAKIKELESKARQVRRKIVNIGHVLKAS